MYRDWPFFRALVENLEMTLAKSSLEIAEALPPARAPRASSRQRFWNVLAGEHARTVEAVLAIVEADALLDRHPVVQRSIRLRNPYVDPINAIQVELLAAWREGDERAATAAAPLDRGHRSRAAQHRLMAHVALSRQRRRNRSGAVAVRSGCAAVLGAALALFAAADSSASPPASDLVASVYRAPEPRGVMVTTGGWAYCTQVRRLARLKRYTLLCGRYAKDRYDGPGRRGLRHLDWGNPGYLHALAASAATLHRQVGGDLVLIGVSYSGFGVAALASRHPELRPARVIVIDSYLDLFARRRNVSPTHPTAREIDDETGGTDAELRARSVSLTGLAQLVRAGKQSGVSARNPRPLEDRPRVRRALVGVERSGPTSQALQQRRVARAGVREVAADRLLEQLERELVHLEGPL